VKSRLGCFLLGFGTGALTVAAYRQLKSRIDTEDYERVADSMQDNLAKLEARLSHSTEAPATRKSA